MRFVAMVVSASVATAGCAGRQPPAPAPMAAPPAPAVDVTALVRQGCFRCLEAALSAASGEQAFEVAALLTLRAKELGVPEQNYRRLAEALAPADPAFASYLAAIDAIRSDGLSGDRYRQDSDVVAAATRVGRDVPLPNRTSALADRAARWQDALQSGPGSELFRRYVSGALDCKLSPRRDGPVATATTDDPPVLQYQAAICAGSPEPLRAFREAHPEFVDGDFSLARYALAARPADVDEALGRITAAHNAFPASLAIGTALGSVHEEREEWRDALAAYGAVLQQMPEHRDALLGQTMSLSRLRRHDEAVASATRMIDLGGWYLGEAYYWRAWNQFSLQQYAQARVDADRAKSLMVNSAVFILSGLIEWNERRLPTAETEFEEALKMDFGRCDAAQYLGRVRVQRNKVLEAIAAFQQAIQCFDLAITVRQKLIADIQSGPGSDATKARLTAGHQRAIADAVDDRNECRQNVAALESRTAPRP